MDYFEGAKETKERLESISPTMCMAKWLQVSMHLPQGLTQSCYHPPTHKIPLNELTVTHKALHNTHEKVLQRKQMWEGERPSGCQYCWNIEDAADGPHLSDRHYRSSEWWVQDAWDEVIEGSWDENINPRYVEVNFNQACNFKCTYCSPHLSTEWEKEIQEHGPYKLDKYIHNDIESLRKAGLMPIKGANKHNPYVAAFWEWWPELYKDLKVFRMTGGEPLMDKNTFDVFDYIILNPNPDLELSITSNLCPPQTKLFDKFLDRMKKLEDSINEETYNDWAARGLLREFTYYAKNDGKSEWKKWPRYLVLFDEVDNTDNIDPTTPRIKFEDIKSSFDSNGLDASTGDFLYTLVWYKPSEKKNWSCIGSKDSGKEGNEGIFLDIPRMKNFMLFASIDSVGEQAEYIRSGLNWKVFEKNVKKFLTNTNNTEITFINTFNLLSIPKLKNFLEFILKLREDFGCQNQVLRTEPDIEEHKGKNRVRKQRQRIWFDIPYLREPSWMSAQNAAFYPELLQMLDECVIFMEQNVEDENYGKTYHGFKRYEIAKLKRDIAWIKSGKTEVSDEEITLRKKVFWEYFSQIDRRRNVDFISTFPELTQWYNDCYTEHKKGTK
jgi:pyruvate-formate lyase-activating enzyme